MKFEIKIKDPITRRLVIAFLALLIVVFYSTIGYMLIEGWDFLSAIYMTVITITTTGYREVNPLSKFGQLYTMAVIISGIIFGTFVLSQFVTILFEGKILAVLKGRKMEQAIRNLNKHVIVCGFGRTGQEVASTLERSGHPFIVIDDNQESIELAKERGYLTYLGDATHDIALLTCGIHRAKGLAAALSSDGQNTFLVLTARGLNSGLTIVSRVVEEGAAPKILRAGADRVVSMYRLGGRRMASLLLRPDVLEFIDSIMFGGPTDLLMEEVIVIENSPLDGNTLAGTNFRKLTGGAMVLGVRPPGKKMIINPQPDIVLNKEDTLLVLGTAEQIDTLMKIASPIVSFPQDRR